MLPRVRAPLTIISKPLTLSFIWRYKAKVEKEGDGEINESICRGRFYRNSQGDTRTEFFADEKRELISLIILWCACKQEISFVSPHQQRIQKATNPNFPREHQWTQSGFCRIQSTNEEKAILGLACTRVLLLPFEEISIELYDETPKLEDACWVSYEWGLVLLYKERTDCREICWEVTSIHIGEPSFSLLETPSGLSEIPL